MLPDRVSNPGPLTYESGAVPIALRGPAKWTCIWDVTEQAHCHNYVVLTSMRLTSLAR